MATWQSIFTAAYAGGAAATAAWMLRTREERLDGGTTFLSGCISPDENESHPFRKECALLLILALTWPLRFLALALDCGDGEHDRD